MAAVTLRPLVEADLDVLDAELDSGDAWTPLQRLGAWHDQHLYSVLRGESERDS